MTTSLKLESFGIFTLTGESCAYSLRILCDVSKEGADLLNKFFGCELQLAQPWNTSTGTDFTVIPNGIREEYIVHDHIGSIMLSRHCLHELLIFCALQFFDVVASGSDAPGVQAMSANEWKELQASMPHFTETLDRYYSPGYDRNVHQMSGRTY